MGSRKSKKKYTPSSADISRLRKKMYPKGSVKKGTAPSDLVLKRYLILTRGRI